MKGTEFYVENTNDFIYYTEEVLWLDKGDVFYHDNQYYLVLFKMYIIDNLEYCKLKIIIQKQ